METVHLLTSADSLSKEHRNRYVQRLNEKDRGYKESILSTKYVLQNDHVIAFMDYDSGAWSRCLLTCNWCESEEFGDLIIFPKDPSSKRYFTYPSCHYSFYDLLSSILNADSKNLVTYSKVEWMSRSDTRVMKTKWQLCLGDVEKFIS